MERNKKHKLRAWLAFFILTCCISLTGCEYSMVEIAGDVPLLGTGLGKAMLGLATMPAVPCHDMMEFLSDTSYLDDLSKAFVLHRASNLTGAVDGTPTSQYLSTLMASVEHYDGGSGGDGLSLEKFWETVQAGFDVMLPIGIALCTTYLIIAVMSLATRENVSLEHYIRLFIKFLISIAVIMNMVTILNMVMRISDATVLKFASTLEEDEDLGNHAWEFLLGTDNPMYGVELRLDLSKNEDVLWVTVHSWKEYGNVTTRTSREVSTFEADAIGEAIMGYDSSEMFWDFNHLCCILGHTQKSGKWLDANYKGDNPFINILVTSPKIDLGDPASLSYSISGHAWTGDNPQTWMVSEQWQSTMIRLMSICISAQFAARDGNLDNNYGIYGYLGDWYSTLGVVGAIALCAFVAKLMAYFVVAQRLLEIAWRTVMAPVSFANVYDGAGGTTPGVRSLKVYFSLCMSAVLLIVILYIGNRFGNDILKTMISVPASHAEFTPAKLILAITVRLATLGAAIGVSNLAKEAIAQ